MTQYADDDVDHHTSLTQLSASKRFGQLSVFRVYADVNSFMDERKKAPTLTLLLFMRTTLDPLSTRHGAHHSLKSSSSSSSGWYGVSAIEHIYYNLHYRVAPSRLLKQHFLIIHYNARKMSWMWLEHSMKINFLHKKTTPQPTLPSMHFNPLRFRGTRWGSANITWYKKKKTLWRQHFSWRFTIFLAKIIVQWHSYYFSDFFWQDERSQISQNLQNLLRNGKLAQNCDSHGPAPTLVHPARSVQPN